MNARVTRPLIWRSALAALLCGTVLQAPLARAADAVVDKSTICDASSHTQVRLWVKVSGLQQSKGKMAITVYADDPKRFLAKGGKLLRVRVPAVAPVTTVCLVLPSVNQYAVAVYHDANADDNFNRTFVGMPAEGFGFSRNPRTLIGLPSLSEVRIPAITGDNVSDIALTYP